MKSRAVLFVAFPYSKASKSWRGAIREIRNELGSPLHTEAVSFPTYPTCGGKVAGLVCYGAVAAKNRGTGGR